MLLLFQMCRTVIFLKCYVIFYHCHSHAWDSLAVPINQDEFQNSWHNMQAYYYWATASPPAWPPLKPGSEQSARIFNFSMSLKVYVVPCV